MDLQDGSASALILGALYVGPRFPHCTLQLVDILCPFSGEKKCQDPPERFSVKFDNLMA